MKFKKITAAFLAAAVAAFSFAGCSANNSASSDKKITLAYQYGIAYLPVLIMEQQGLLEKHLPEGYTVEYQVINSGTSINDGVTAGDIDVAYIGFAPAITGATKGIYKIYSGIGAAPNGLITKDNSKKTLKDFKSGDQISVVGIGSAQHLYLAMAAKEVLGDARALDSNLIAASHPDGLQSMLNGQVTAQVTATPYLEQGIASEGVHEIEEVREAFPEGLPFIFGATSEAFHSNTEAYQALVDATNEAFTYIEENKDASAELLSEKTDISKQDILKYMDQDDVFFSAPLPGIMEVAKFMYEEKFIDAEVTSLSDIAWDNVTE